MKRKYGDRADWARILAHTFTVARVERPAFSGVVTLYTMLAVREPLYKPVAGELTLIADAGYRWLQLYSDDQQSQTYTVTAAFDTEDVILQWYIDVCAAHGVDHTGIPWHDDLYLDLVANQRGGVAVIDANDLDAAVDSGATPPSSYHLSWNEVHRLAPLVHSGRLPEMRFAREALEAMRAIERGSAVTGYIRLAPPSVTSEVTRAMTSRLSDDVVD